uniref:Rapid alkalinization factor 5 n=1 Tax=Pyrus x bretschneideri TaxID=225117 RepID=A0A650EQI1_9ROSA|nr:rapid alkalinization factor 5 [Pyrus x bretschneideri]
MVVLNSEVKGERNRIDPGVLDRCRRPGGPHPGCYHETEGPRKPINPYNRGCSIILRCRHGQD